MYNFSVVKAANYIYEHPILTSYSKSNIRSNFQEMKVWKRHLRIKKDRKNTIELASPRSESFIL